MKTTKTIFAPLIIALSMLLGGAALADPISISESCSSPDAATDNPGCDPTAGGDYGFTWTVLAEGDTSDPTATYTTFGVTLTNTAPTGSSPVIDAFAFNLAGADTLVAAVDGVCPTLSASEVCFDNINPSTWTITISGNNISFEYVGNDDTGRGSTQDRIVAGGSLTFDITFNPDRTYGEFTDSGTNDGGGFGGGQESGQVCVSFQSLPNPQGDGTNESDLLCGDYGDTPMKMSEPGTLALLGLGLVGLGLARRRRNAA